ASEKQEAKSGILEAAGFPDPGKKASPLVVAAAAAAAAVAAQGGPLPSAAALSSLTSP
ncbi:GLI2 isoform 9, partial [Pan troglodytes]